MSNQNAKARKTQPDYDHWSKYDKWDFKEAALLLNGLEPSDYLKVRFNSKEIPTDPDLKMAHKTFLILKKCNGFEYSNYAHPTIVLKIAREKDLKIPDELFNKFVEQSKRKNERREKTVSRNQNAESGRELSTRERHSFLKTIGVMSHMLKERSPRCLINARPNAYQISQAVQEKAESMGVNTDGLKSLDRKITEALLFLEEEKEYDSEY